MLCVSACVHVQICGSLSVHVQLHVSVQVCVCVRVKLTVVTVFVLVAADSAVRLHLQVETLLTEETSHDALQLRL